MILNEKELGFDLDEETVVLLDAILTNIATDPELKEEFKKLKFIKSLGDNYNNKRGPMRQLLDKVADIERDRFHANMDLRRLISDMQHLAQTVEKLVGNDNSFKAIEVKESLKGIAGINNSSKFYTFNSRGK